MHPQQLNSRVLHFLTAHRLPDSTLTRDEHGEVRRVPVGKLTLPWTVHYMLWIQLQWRAWARTLGFRDADAARRAGHTHEAFDAWLARSVAAGSARGASAA